MKKLNRNKPFGKITPPYDMPDLDRAAHYEQDGMFFDGHDREIVPGQPLQLVQEPKVEPAEVAVVDTEVTSAAELLLKRSENMSVVELRKEAKIVLGDDAPKKAADIIEALQLAVAAQSSLGETPEPSQTSEGLTWSGLAGGDDGIDLLAWGRGQKEYLWSEVQQEIRKEHHKQVSERRDAVDFLIEMGLLKSAEARTDI